MFRTRTLLTSIPKPDLDQTLVKTWITFWIWSFVKVAKKKKCVFSDWKLTVWHCGPAGCEEPRSGLLLNPLHGSNTAAELLSSSVRPWRSGNSWRIRRGTLHHWDSGLEGPQIWRQTEGGLWGDAFTNTTWIFRIFRAHSITTRRGLWGENWNLQTQGLAGIWNPGRSLFLDGGIYLNAPNSISGWESVWVSGIKMQQN